MGISQDLISVWGNGASRIVREVLRRFDKRIIGPAGSSRPNFGLRIGTPQSLYELVDLPLGFQPGGEK